MEGQKGVCRIGVNAGDDREPWRRLWLFSGKDQQLYRADIGGGEAWAVAFGPAWHAGGAAGFRRAAGGVATSAWRACGRAGADDWASHGGAAPGACFRIG